MKKEKTKEIKTQKGFKEFSLYTVSLANGMQYTITQIHKNGACRIDHNTGEPAAVAASAEGALRYVRHHSDIKNVEPANSGWFGCNDKFARSVPWC